MRISDWSSDVCSSDLRRAEWAQTPVRAHGPFSTAPIYQLLVRLFENGTDKAPRQGRAGRHSQNGAGQTRKTERRAPRTEESRVVKECVSKCRGRGERSHYKNKTTRKTTQKKKK